MTSTLESGIGAPDDAIGLPDKPRRTIPRFVVPLVVGGGCVVALANLTNHDSVSRAAVFDAMSVVAAVSAVVGVICNSPRKRSGWLLFTIGLLLFVGGDIVFDVRVVAGGDDSGYPYADAMYLAAYPCLAFGLYKLSFARFRRDAAIDAAIVSVAAAAVIFQWVLTPVLAQSGSATIERVIAVTYPIMDIVLIIAMVHAVFTLRSWRASAWMLFAGLTVMLGADIVYAQLIAQGHSGNDTLVDALWPIAYLLLAGAALHPSMRRLWASKDAGPTQYSRARLAVLGAAMFAAPAVVILNSTENAQAAALATIAGVAAILVVWRIARLVSETNRAREILTDSEARFRALVQYGTDIVAVLRDGGVIAFASPAVIDILGRAPEDLVGTGAADLAHPDDMATVHRIIDALLAHPDSPVTFQMRVLHVDGTYRWIEATCTNQLDQPSVRGIVGNFRDIDLRKRADAYRASETRALEMLLEGRPLSGTLRVLVDTLSEYVGDAFVSIRLIDPDEWLPLTAASAALPQALLRALGHSAPLVDPRTADEVRLGALAIRTPDELGDLSVREAARSSGIRLSWCSPIVNPDDANLVGLVDVFTHDARVPTALQHAIIEHTRDLVSLAVDRAARTRELGHLALHDTLTGLPNRSLVTDRLEQALARLGDRHGMLAVFFIDLDRFKVVNDALGHDTGDELLVSVGKRLNATVRRQDTVARLGGDEFVVLCEDLADERLAQDLAARAVEALSAPFALHRAEVTVTPSIGIAVTRRPGDSPSNLLRDADAAMYRAKERGGSRFELFDEAMHTQAVARLLTERALRQALREDQLRVVFQTQFDLRDYAPICDEALLRWAHPTRDLILPGEFLPVAYETGMIVPIGRWVIEQASTHTQRAAAHGHVPASVSVNMSGRNLLRAELPAAVTSCLEEYDLRPDQLGLEISEIALLDDLELTNGALRALKDLGIRLSIDDFGTGGSSLTYLRQFPFDELKIDSSFVQGVGRNAADDAIVAATIDMAHALGMVVAAEGVETQEQLDRLVALGCDRAQGFLLSQPVPDADAVPGPVLQSRRAEDRPRLQIVRDQSA